MSTSRVQSTPRPAASRNFRTPARVWEARRAAAVKTALTLVVLLSGVPCVNAQTKTVDRTVALTPTGSITLEAHNGSIDVRTWDRPEVQVHVQIDAASSSAQDVRRFNSTTVDVSSTRDSVRISTV